MPRSRGGTTARFSTQTKGARLDDKSAKRIRTHAKRHRDVYTNKGQQKDNFGKCAKNSNKAKRIISTVAVAVAVAIAVVVAVVALVLALVLVVLGSR